MYSYSRSFVRTALIALTGISSVLSTAHAEDAAETLARATAAYNQRSNEDLTSAYEAVQIVIDSDAQNDTSMATDIRYDLLIIGARARYFIADRMDSDKAKMIEFANAMA